MTIMARILLTTALTIGRLISPTSLWAQQVPEQQAPQQALDITGVYECQGTNPEGRSYGSVVTVQKYGDVYKVQWFSQNDISLGIGILKGSNLAVSYFIESLVGLVLYRVDADKLVGEWSIFGSDGKLYPEVLIKMEGHPIPELDPDSRSPVPEAPKPRQSKESSV